MKNRKFIYNKLKAIFTVALITMTVSCERGLTDDAEFVTFPANGDVFIDAFSGLDYFPFVDAGADPEAFSVVTDEVYEGTAAIRFDVPSFGNGFVGATFNATSNRDLSGYDALTFYAKASQSATINNIGFGISGDTGNKYQVTLNNLEISTNWKKYEIPIPDASKLTNESGLFWLAEGASFPGDEGGYVLWFDEIKFENLGTIAQPNPKIFDGEDLMEQSFIGTTLEMTGLTQTFNMGSGINRTVSIAPSYYDFLSTEIDVARVSERGEISIVGEGTAKITALLGDVLAEGSLEISSIGEFQFAPTPTRDPSSVVSLFSDAYTDVPVSRYNSFFEPFQTTLGGVTPVGNESIISYTNLNFVGIVFNDVIFPSEAVQPINANNLTHLHIDINVQEALQSGDRLLLQLTNYGASNTVGSYLINSNELATDSWVSFDIPLADFAGLSDLSRIGLLLFNSEDGPASPTISNLFLDNIYFY